MVIVWGEVLWDRFPDGAQLGGAPANVAWHLAGLGTPVALVTRVGDDADGADALARLGARGVDLTLAQRDPVHATGEVAVTVVDGEPRYTLCADRAWEHLAMSDAVAAALPGARALIYGTLAQRTPAGLAAWTAALAATSPRVVKICDPNLRGAAATADDDRALAAALEAADVVKLNHREVAAIARRLGHADPVAWLLGRGARLVAVTHGAEGSTWYAPGLTVPVAAVPAAPGGDAVGCGDAYLAGLTHGLLAGWPWPRIARLASALAAAVAGVRGATPALDGPEVLAAMGPA
jgi:fructokinase